MEELAIERRAAFRAIQESSSHSPLLFEVEPSAPSLREELDALVDRSSLFCGLYYATFGTPYLTELFGMTPIEYEFFRFVVRFDFLEKSGSKHEVHRTLAHAMDDRLKQLGESWDAKQEYLEQSRIIEIIRERVRIFLREGASEFSRVNSLARFVDVFRRIDGPSPDKKSRVVWRFGPREVPDPIDEKAPPQYLDPWFELYVRMRHQLSRAWGKVDLDWYRRRKQPEKITFVAEGLNAPGILYRLLGVFFTFGFNIEALKVELHKERRKPETATVYVTVTQYYAAPENLHDVVQKVLERLVRQLRGVPAWTISRRKGRRFDSKLDVRRNDPKWVVLKIDLANVPGMFMAIARMIATLGGDVRRASYNSTSAKPSLSLTISLPTLDDDAKSSDRGSPPADGKWATELSALLRETGDVGVTQNALEQGIASVIGVRDIEPDRVRAGSRGPKKPRRGSGPRTVGR